MLLNTLVNLITELSWTTIRTRINITDMFKETEEVCKAAKIMDKQHIIMCNKFTGGKIKLKALSNQDRQNVGKAILVINIPTKKVLKDILLGTIKEIEMECKTL